MVPRAATVPEDQRRVEDLLAQRGGRVELLRLPAALFGIVAGIRGGLYDRGFLPVGRVDAPVVSVGNLTAGGTGKTPMVMHLAHALLERGRRPGLLSRGYRAPQRTGAQDKQMGSPAVGAEVENDEGRLLAQKLPDLPRVQDADRIRGARRLIEAGADVILLDDGFQHRRLHRDLDVVLVDATRPWGLPPDGSGASVRAYLPRGLLREKPGSLGRADAVCLTRCDQVEEEELDRLESELRFEVPGIALLRARHRPSSVRAIGPGTEELFHPSALAGREVDLVSAIGNPSSFETTVARLGARIRTHRRFPDHHDFSEQDLNGLGDDRWLVTTEKDAVKLDSFGRILHVVAVDFVIDQGALVLEALLDALPIGRRDRERRSLHEGLHG